MNPPEPAQINQELHEAESVMQDKISLLSDVMTKGIRRWEKVIYPMMLAFILLAGYGFYLIVNLTKDMTKITDNMVLMTEAVVTMQKNLDKQLTSINIEMKHIEEMNYSIQNMNQTLIGIHQSVYYMAQTTGQMNSHISELNDNISKPMGSFNSFMPWSMMPSSSNNNRYKNSNYPRPTIQIQPRNNKGQTP